MDVGITSVVCKELRSRTVSCDGHPSTQGQVVEPVMQMIRLAKSRLPGIGISDSLFRCQSSDTRSGSETCKVEYKDKGSLEKRTVRDVGVC